MKRQLKVAIAGVLAGVSSHAMAANEVEVNHPIAAAQYLTTDPQGVNVAGAVGALGGKQDKDLDFFRFSGQAGDVVTIDIDNGWGGSHRVDTILGVFDKDLVLLRQNDTSKGLDPGSTSTADARIDNFVLPYTGQYTVGVSAYPRYFATGGGTYNTTMNPSAGDYNLVISGLSPAVTQVAIVIKPGSEEVAPLNPKSRGKIPVAILGGPTFNALSIDKNTLTFGASGDEKSLSKCDLTGTDINGDGRVDVVCHFENQLAGFQRGDIEGTVRGSTVDGAQFEGTGFLKVVPEKRQ